MLYPDAIRANKKDTSDPIDILLNDFDLRRDHLSQCATVKKTAADTASPPHLYFSSSI